MPHLHTESGQHDLTVTAFVVRMDESEPTVLLHMHRTHKRLMPVGGHVELSETPWQAVGHELSEESGYTLADLHILQPPDRMEKLRGANLHPYPVVVNTHVAADKHYHTDLSYAFVATHKPQRPVAANESKDLRWLTRQELDRLVEPTIFLNTQDTYRYVLDVCLVNWQLVEPAVYLARDVRNGYQSSVYCNL